MMVGLFADWRDLSVSIDFELATILGTIVQISQKIQSRQWGVFNALRKPERTFVNVQTLDFERRAGFVPLGESMWRGGDQLPRPHQRKAQLDWVRQPASFNIVQQEEHAWWISIAVEHSKRPTSWMRHFVFSFREA